MPNLIKDVSDTSLWVAHYRAVESARPDALFQDRFAAEVSEQVNRPSPMPKIFILAMKLIGPRWSAKYKKMSGYVLFERQKASPN